MRLLLTADAVGGVWQYATDLARALKPHGIEPVVALLGPAPSPAQRIEAADLRIVETGLPLDWLCDGPEPVLAAGRAIAQFAADERAEIVQINMPTLAAEARFPCPVVAVTHGCVATWWEAARPEPLAPGYHWHRTLMRWGLAKADRVVAPSRAYAGHVARHYRVAMPEVVANGRRPLALPAGAKPAPGAFTAGRLWDTVKNTAMLDRVAARLAIPFEAAGALRGPHDETVTVRHLRIAGVLDERGVAAKLAGQPVFVSAATFEPFGLAVLEAAAAGCPLVLSDIPTFRELWDGAATFVAADDEDGYVAAIGALAADPARRATLGRAAQTRAARYLPDAMAAGMAALFARLVPAAGRAAA